MGKVFINKVIEIALNEIGYHEKASNKDLDYKNANAGSGNWTKYARDLWDAVPHYYQGCKNGFDWCTIFVDWCIYRAAGNDSNHAQEIVYYSGPYGAGCGPSVQYYKAAKAWYSEPMLGDQIFFGTEASVKHTGLVVAIEENYIYTVEGNANNCVLKRKYKKTDSCIVGYGRPAYDGFGVETFPFVDVPKDAWYREAAEWCYNKGIVAGVDSKHMAPNAACSRAEVMQMLYRALT